MTVHRLDIKREKTAIIKDFIPLCFIALFGSIGFAYIFNSDCISEFHAKSTSTKVHLAANSISFGSFSNNTELPFNIEGNHFSNATLTFQMVDFDPQAKYLLELGNGEIIKINESTFEYSFAEAGPYRLNLNIKYPNQRPMIVSQNLIIEDTKQASVHNNPDNI